MHAILFNIIKVYNFKLLRFYFFFKYRILRTKPGKVNYKPNIFEKLIFILLKSNHPNRFYALYNYSNNINFYKNAGKYIDNRYNNKYIKKVLFFCGDSHVEFYSRLNFETNKSPKVFDFLSYSIWFGHTSIITMHFNDYYTNRINLIFKYINSLNLKDKEFNFVFSLGDTDIRFMFYKILKLGFFKDLKSLLNILRQIFEEFMSYLKEKILKKYPNSKLFFLEIIYNDSEGYINDNINELKLFIKNNPFTVLGSNDDFFTWTKLVNEIIRESCRKNGINFITVNNKINNNSYQKNFLFSNGFSIDGIHLTEPLSANLIKNIINEIFEKNM